MGINIRYANKDDANDIGLIYSTSYQEAFKGIIPDNILQGVFSFEKRRDGIYEELCEENIMNAIMFEDKKPVGMVTCAKSKYEELDDSFIEIWRIYLLPSHWGKGIGSELMNWTLRELQKKGYSKVVLWVIEDNIRARKFYEKMGFKHDGITRIIDCGKKIKDLRYIYCSKEQ